nr:MAG TPA: hypothetical protein [Caudoviricetes sp.]
MYTLRLFPPIVSSTSPVFNFSYFSLQIYEYYLFGLRTYLALLLP